MQIAIKGDELQITIRGNLDFAKASNLLGQCKRHSLAHDRAKLKLSLENIKTINTCVIGALLAISEWMPGGSEFILVNCSAEINAFLGSDVLDKHFSPHPRSICITCFERHTEMPDKACGNKELDLFDLPTTLQVGW